jgi:hypothetical protein
MSLVPITNSSEETAVLDFRRDHLSTPSTPVVASARFEPTSVSWLPMVSGVTLFYCSILLH